MGITDSIACMNQQRVIETFKEAWHAADEEGREGERVEAGLNAVLGELADRLRRANSELSALRDEASKEAIFEDSDRKDNWLRLVGKIEGVRLAQSYVEEALR